MKIKQSFQVDFEYSIEFTEGIFNPENHLLASYIKPTSTSQEIKIGVAIDSGVLCENPSLHEQIETYFGQFPGISLAAPPVSVTGGEEVKNSTEDLQKVLELIDYGKIDRHSYLIGIGGGAVLDMVGFAAAIGHRGIRHIRIPTTVLSQNDSGVGVKNGINYFGKKNFLGAFAPPYLVINDFLFLKTLSERDWRSGMSEAVKVALIKDARFFYWLEENASLLHARDMEAMKKLVVDCARLHAEHIAGNNDPFETGSSRPLDFGHWAAHKMEKLSDFQIKHGEAVAIGIALDIYYGGFAGFMPMETCERIVSVLAALGFDLYHPVLTSADEWSVNPLLLDGLEEFREHLGGELTITMVSVIGEKFDVHAMNKELISKAVLHLKTRENTYANPAS